MQCVFAGAISKQNMKYCLKSCTRPFEGVQCAFPDVWPSFQRSDAPFRKANISAQYLQYYWQRASLSKVQYVWTSEHYWRTLLCFLPQSSRILSCMAKKSSCEEATFLENWTCIWHVYSSPWSDQPSLHLDNSHLKKCFQYYRTIMFSFNRISHSYQGDVAQIQQQILQGRPYSFKRMLHA